MIETNIPLCSGVTGTGPVVERLLQALPGMSPQLRKAAGYILDNPRIVGVNSIREVAEAAGVKPNTLVRMARAAGCDGYDDFRRPFRDALRERREDFPDKARWLQSIARKGKHGRLFGDMAAAAFDNVQELYAGTNADEMKSAADRIIASRKTFVLGVGVSYALARNFTYLARMALDDVVAIPQDGSLPIDDIAKAGPADVLLAMTFAPYRTEVVEAVHIARSQDVRIIALSDSRASPVILAADHAFVIPTDTPQFFTSTVATAAFLETLMAFVIAAAGPHVVPNIDKFHQRRHDLGIYWDEGK